MLYFKLRVYTKRIIEYNIYLVSDMMHILFEELETTAQPQRMLAKV